jgi:DNA-binding MarR family transcriptional regulator
MNNKEKNIDNYLMPWLGKTMKFIDYYVADKLRESNIDLTKTQVILLFRLERADGQPQHNLAFITNRDKASLARLLTTMENKNLVARIPSKEDGRVNNIYLTKHGEEMLGKVKPLMASLLDEVQNGLEKEDIRKVIEVMKKIQENTHTEELVALQTN